MGTLTNDVFFSLNVKEGDVSSIGFGLGNGGAQSDSGPNYGANEHITGLAKWSNLEVFELPSLSVKLDGGLVKVPNHQISYKSFTEDNRPISDHLIYVDSTGLSATTKGNMWRAFELPEPLSIYELGDFVVSFDFSLEEVGEWDIKFERVIEEICLNL